MGEDTTSSEKPPVSFGRRDFISVALHFWNPKPEFMRLEAPLSLVESW